MLAGNVSRAIGRAAGEVDKKKGKIICCLYTLEEVMRWASAVDPT